MKKLDAEMLKDWSYSLKSLKEGGGNRVASISYPGDVGEIQKVFVSTKFKKSSEEEEDVEMEDLVASLREFLGFGKWLGILPVSGIFECGEKKLALRKSSFGRVYSVAVILGLGFNAFIALIGFGRGRQATNAGDYAWAPVNFIFYALGTFVFLYFHKYAGEFIEIFSKWKSVRMKYTEVDSTLRRDANIVAGIVMASAILENAVSHLKLFPLVKASEVSSLVSEMERENQSAFEIYYIRSHRVWADLIPFNPVIATFVFLSNKFCLYAWNYMDLMIVLLARALYFKFKVLYTIGERLLLDGGQTFDQEKWRIFARDHETLCGIVGDFESFLSPMIFASFAVNVYFVCLQMHLGLTPSGKSSYIASIYAVWSFLHLVGRVYLISLSGSRVNEWAHKILNVCRKCPNESYIIEVERSERFVSMSTIGLSGLRCFIITKPLLLQIVGVVFTFEIVLLQAAQTPLEPAAAGHSATTTTTACPVATTN